MTESSVTAATQESEVAQAAGIIALGSVASRILGVVRETVKAGLFGATGSVSALEVAIRIPTLVYDLLVGGMINSALIPVFSEYVSSDRRNELWHLLSVLLSLAAVVLSVVTLLGELLAPQIVWVMAGGLDPVLQREAVALLRLMLPAIFFLNVAGIVSGALYALKRFSFPAFTAAAFNAAIVVVALLLGRRLGVTSIALGLLAGSVLQLSLQLPGLRGARLRFIFDSELDALRRIGKLYVPIALGLIVDMLGVALSYHLASRTGDQSIPWMQYSATIIQFPLGLVSIAVSIAILPTLSRQVANDEPEDYKATLAHGLRLVLALTIPATVGLWVLAQPIVALVFEHGSYFTPSDTQATVGALHCHLVGLIFAAIDQPLIFAFYARKDTWTPALVGVGTVVLYVAIALAPALFWPLTLNWLILANSLKSAVHALAMLFLLQRGVGALRGRRVWQTLLKATLSSVVMGGAVWLVVRTITSIVPPDGFRELVLVAGGGLVGVGVYWILASVTKIGEVADLGRILLARVRILTAPRR
ncbi:MAG: murein biosynthesis integral membrane protein MurJ [Anaerolineae bacterium]|nr:murein biosynthesis integral membrane protein MurJ [Anaerolineae bacterium]